MVLAVYRVRCTGTVAGVSALLLGSTIMCLAQSTDSCLQFGVGSPLIVPLEGPA